MALKKVLTLPTVISTSAGITLATSCFVAAMQVASYMAGDSAWLAIVVAGSLTLLAALSFSELNGLLPSASGIRLYFTRAYGNSVSLTISIFYVFTMIAVVGTEAYVFAQVVKQVLPTVPPFLWALIMIGSVVFMNIRGVKIAGRFQDTITYGLIISLLIFAFLALIKNGFAVTQPLTVSSAGGLLNAVAVGVFLFIGFEWVTPLAEEVTQVKLVSKGMLIAIGILSIVYGVFTVAMTSTVPKAQLVGSPVPHIIFARKLLGSTGLIWMVILSFSASITTFNAGALGASRLIYATAREHALPAILNRLSVKHFTPWTAVTAVGVICLAVAAIVFATGHYLTLVDVGAGIVSLVYALAGLSTFRLRRKMADAERPFKIKGGALIPLATFVVFLLLMVVVLSQDTWAAIYIVIGLIISAAYVRWVVPKLKQKHQATKRGPSRRPRPAQIEETLIGNTVEDADFLISITNSAPNSNLSNIDSDKTDV